ncbi:MAG: hypothetical protein GY947_22375 [Rhodobacteraceae bacterium]|nr:hypothetical protein [Paracoccaceae bacterium]
MFVAFLLVLAVNTQRRWASAAKSDARAERNAAITPWNTTLERVFEFSPATAYNSVKKNKNRQQ